MTDPARWARIQELFHRAAEMREAERRPFLETACGDDPSLVAEVLALLREDAGPESLLDRGLPGAAAAVLRDPAGGREPRATFGPYRVLGVLGEGGMGVVYLAERADLGQRVALKVLRDASLSPARRERFATERRTLAQLVHPAIAQLHDADSLDDGTPWFAMEYVEGAPLTEYCRQHGTSVRGRLELLRRVAEAVQHAHRHAVIHRDLKPSNILVTADGAVKLLDFGIAKQVETLDLGADQTRTGLRLMTPAYAAPEQIRGDRIGTHTDVYSLGVLLYELLAGRLPFDLAGLTPGEAATLVTEHEPVRPSAAVRGPGAGRDAVLAAGAVDRASWTDLDVLCLTAMHRDPARRYRTVDALIRDLDHFLAGEPLDARPDTLGYRLGKFVRRNEAAVAAAAAVAALLVGLVGFYTIRLAGARNEALAEAARSQRIQRFMENLFQGGDADAGPADSLRVVTLLARGVQEARGLDGDPEAQADLYATLGALYQQLGDLARADTLLGLALEGRRATHGPGHPEVARSLVALGVLRADQASYAEAERLIREALALADRRGREHPVRAEATIALGRVLEERGRYDEAIALLEEAVRVRSAGPPGSPELTAAMYQLANAHFYAGHLDASDSLNRVLLAVNQQRHGARHPEVAHNLVNLGASEQERGNYVEAERLHRQALEIFRGWYGDDHPETASGLTLVGRALLFQGRHDEAAAALTGALAVRERVFGPRHPAVASTLNELASIARQQDRYDEAEAMYVRMEAIYRAIHGDDHYLIALAMANRASVYMNSRRHAAAEPLFREVIARYTRAQGADHFNTGIARIKLGRVLLRQGRFAEAAEESRAGYDILTRTTNPGISFLRAARQDLVAAFDSLGRPGEAARFRAELADTAAPASR